MTVFLVALGTTFSGQQVSSTGQAFLTFLENGNTTEILKVFEEDTQQMKTDLGMGLTPLHYAAYFQNVSVFDYLLQKGGDLNTLDQRGLTPIEQATTMNSVEIINLLVSKGAGLQVPSSRLPLLHRATVSRGAEVLHYLLDRGFEINEKDNTGRTPLMMAVDFGNLEAARALILRGADINLANSEGIVPIQIAVKKGSADLIDLFIRKTQFFQKKRRKNCQSNNPGEAGGYNTPLLCSGRWGQGLPWGLYP